jgi:hypothetical protein
VTPDLRLGVLGPRTTLSGTAEHGITAPKLRTILALMAVGRGAAAPVRGVWTAPPPSEPVEERPLHGRLAEQLLWHQAVA